MITRLRSRPLLLAGAILLVAILLIPITSLDAAQSAGLPLIANRLWFRLAILMAMFVVLASAWNLVGGLTGYAAFGNVAFFGLGAYAVGVIVVKLHLPFYPGLLAAAVVPALFAILIGVPLLRLRGHYFAVASLGVSVAVGELINNTDQLGGSTGLFLPIIADDIVFFYLMVAAALLTAGTTWVVLHNRLGYGLIAIRENEEAAAVMGVNTTFYKVTAFALSAGLTGLAGGIFAGYNGFVNQENVFPITFNVQMILMALLGGSGTVVGPIIGAIGLQFLIQGLSGGLAIPIPFLSDAARAVFAQVVLGLLLVVTVTFVPRGIVDFFGGTSRFSLAYFRRSLRETSV